jgi:hypothetical protein
MQCKEGRKRYNPTESTTYRNPEVPLRLDIRFGTAELQGPQGIDDFHIGPFTVRQQAFGLIEKEVGSTFEELPLEGIVGLGFPSLAAAGAKPFFDTVIKQKVLTHNEFAFFFDSSGDEEDAAAILWGGVDRNLHDEPIRMVPVVQAHYWSLALHGFKVGSKDVIKQPRPSVQGWGSWFRGDTEGPLRGKQQQLQQPLDVKLVVDTGTNSYTAPPAIYDTLTDMLPDTTCEKARRYPNITFTLQDAAGELFDLVIPPFEYMGVAPDGKLCQLAFMSLEVYEPWGPAILLGETFLRNYLTVFDRGDGSNGDARVGFARSIKGAETREVLSSLQKMQNSLWKHHAAASMSAVLNQQQ